MTATPFRTLTLTFAAGAMTLAAPASALPTASGSAHAEAAPVYGEMTFNHGRDRHDRGNHRGWQKQRERDYRYQSYSRYSGPAYDSRPYYARYPSNYGEPVYRNTRVWQGDDGRYYCRKSNGTTGLLVGGAVGALLGREVAGRGGDRTLGAILGAAGGALLGRSLDSGTRCG